MTEYFVDWVVSCLNYCEGKPPPPGGDYELYENDSRYRSKYDRKLFEYDLFMPINPQIQEIYLCLMKLETYFIDI